MAFHMQMERSERIAEGTEGVRGPRVEPSAVTFEAFFHEEYGRCLRALYLVTGNPHEAEELAQDSFIAVWERWDRVSQMENPTGYLYRAALNKHRSGLRRATRAARRTLGMREGSDLFAASDERDSVARALARLTPRQRETIVLVELLGYPAEEAGLFLGIERVTVRVHASNARAAMKNLLEETDE